MSNKTLDLSKPVQTRDGRKCRIICTDRKGERPLIGLVMEDNGLEVVYCWRTDGNYEYGTEADLVNRPETVRVCFFYNIMGPVSCRCCKGYSDQEAKSWGRHICFKDIVLDE